MSIAAASGCADVLGIPEGRRVDPNAMSVDGTEGAAATCTGAIHLRVLTDTFGPTKEISYPHMLGEVDYFRELNERGGILGCRVEWKQAEYGYNAERAEALYAEWKKEPSFASVVALFGLGSPDTLRLGPLVKVDKKVLISASFAGPVASPDPVQVELDVPEIGANFIENLFPTKLSSDGYPYNFFLGTDYSTAIRIAMFHVKVKGGARVGFARCAAGSSAFCLGPLAAGRTYAKQLGLEIGRDLTIELNDDEATTTAKLRSYLQEENAKAAADPAYRPVDWLWVGNLPVSTANIGKALDRVMKEGATPKLSKVELIVNNFGFDEGLFGRCGQACVGRVHGVMPFTAFGDKSRQSSEMAKVVALHDKWRKFDFEHGAPGVERSVDLSTLPPTQNVRYVQGYVAAQVFKVAVERVVAARLPVTAENVKATLETFRSVDTGGLTDRLSFTAKDHRPQSTVAVYRIAADGKLEYEPPDRTISLDPSWLGW